MSGTLKKTVQHWEILMFGLRLIFIAVVAVIALTWPSALLAQQATDDALIPLDLSLTHPVSELRQMAEAGNVEAQYAMSIISRWGLHGERQDLEDEAEWRSRASRQGPSTTVEVTAVMPGQNGQSPELRRGTVQRGAAVSEFDAVIRPCTLSLHRGAAAPSCGVLSADRERRQALWVQARTSR